MTKLSVNVNKVATLRNTRTIGIPSVVRAAELCLDAGAQGITIHPRPDQRHIRPGDVFALAAMLDSYPNVEFNIEGNPFEGDYLDYIKQTQPDQCTLVPDDASAFTSDHGWDLTKDGDRLRPLIAELKAQGCRVSLFMDAEASRDFARAADLGADRIELYTAPYAEAFVHGGAALGLALGKYTEAARLAHAAGLGVNAGHDLSLENLGQFLNDIPNVLEVSIGHALIAEALEFGLPETVRRYLAITSSRA